MNASAKKNPRQKETLAKKDFPRQKKKHPRQKKDQPFMNGTQLVSAKYISQPN